MVIKESSDVLHSPEVVDLGPSQAVRARTGKDYLALTIATCGVGYLPLAPGTWGSLLAVGIYFLVHAGWARYATDTTPSRNGLTFLFGQVLAIAVISVVGIWAASQTERILQMKDPGKVVVDEVAGQLVAFLPLPLTRVGPWPVFVIFAFLLFRLFDIVKPYPARKFEAFHGGLGIMADDLAAGAYAALVVASVVAVRSFM